MRKIGSRCAARRVLTAALAVACIGLGVPRAEAADDTTEDAVDAVDPGTAPREVEPGPATAAAAAATGAAGGLQVIVHERGRITQSTGGAGTTGAWTWLSIDKPPGATLRRAVFFAASTGFRGPGTGQVSIDGQPVGFTHSAPSNIESTNYWADVTGLVGARIAAAPAGPVAFLVAESSPVDFDGVILVAIFDDPAQDHDRSVTLLFGAMKTAGDDFTLGLAEPIDLSDPDLVQEMSLGISYGYQGFGSSQYSEVDVNGSRLTSSAGGEDDGEPINGSLITVGGVGDSPANPPPYAHNTGPRTDDELYDLVPFVADGSTRLTVATRNPSADDNVFFASFTMNPPVTEIETGNGAEYVAVGDSTTTGFSVPTCTENRVISPYGCMGTPPATPYPERIAAADARFDDLDRKGIWGYSVTEAVTAYEVGHNVEGTWVPQLVAAEQATELVTVSLGANDMQFSDVQYWLGRCVGVEQKKFLGIVYGYEVVVRDDECRAAATDRATAEPLSADMDTMFDILDGAAGNGATVAVSLYYNPYNDRKVVDFLPDRSCSIVHGIGDIINSAINTELRQRAEAHGFEVVDLGPPFEGHGAGSDDSYVFGTECEAIGALTAVDFDLGWPPVDTGSTMREVQRRFDPHPNAAGTAVQAETFLEVVR
ncbi:MAG TPA: hypothetical protein VF640_03510 [Acidimicrobiales bacterium]|jgi:lysophospholipase L1-like esterase